MQLNDGHRLYWRKNRVVIAVLLAIWFTITFVVSYFARELSFKFFGWPFSFWMGAQGSVLGYVLIVAFYAWYMNRLDVAHEVADEIDDADDVSTGADRAGG